MFCKACGKNIDIDSAFCSFCGSKQSIDLKPNVETDTTTSINTNQKVYSNESNFNNTPNIVHQPKYDLTYEKEQNAMFVGIILLIISLLVTINGPYEFENEISNRQFRAVSALVSFVLRIFVTGWVISIAKRQNREPFGWGVLAFFLPSIALIIIVQLRKLYKPNEKQINLLSKEQPELSFDIDNIEVPRIASIKNDTIIFVDGTKAEVIKDIKGRYFFVSNFGRHYYKTQDAAIRAAYLQKVTDKISKVHADD